MYIVSDDILMIAEQESHVYVLLDVFIVNGVLLEYKLK